MSDYFINLLIVSLCFFGGMYFCYLLLLEDFKYVRNCFEEYNEQIKHTKNVYDIYNFQVDNLIKQHRYYVILLKTTTAFLEKVKLDNELLKDKTFVEYSALLQESIDSYNKKMEMLRCQKNN